MDHIVPRTQGGISCWTNCVLACLKCNLKKAGRTPAQAGMSLVRWTKKSGEWVLEPYSRPVKPRPSPLYKLPKITEFPSDWKNFLQLKNDELYWHVELKP